MGNLAIIPARSGSKGLKDKNIKELNGKPLMAYSIESAIISQMFDTVHVSTDSEKYATIAQQYSADVPFLRDARYAEDYSSTWDVVRNVLDEYQKRGKKFGRVAILQPTSPLRNEKHIIECFKLFDLKKAEAVVSVCEVEHSPLVCGQIPENGSLKNFIDSKVSNLPRQELPSYFRINGAIYLFNTRVLSKYKSIYDCDIYSYIMDREYSIDIDSGIDFRYAELMLTEQSRANKKTD